MTNNEPSISVVMATYNGERYVMQQVESILRQLTHYDELIVSDDSSTDNTLEMIRSCSDDRVRILRSKGAKGPIGNFENGLQFATKDIVVLADQDDIWLPDRLRIIREYFSSSCFKYDLLILNSMVVNEDLEVSAPSIFKILNSGPGVWKNMYRNTYIGCHMSFKRDLLAVALPFPRRIPMHDVWIGLVSELVGKVTFCDNATMLFRRTGFNFTKPKYSVKTRIIWRLGLAFSLFCFFLKSKRILDNGC